jgi:hypothetical protein
MIYWNVTLSLHITDKEKGRKRPRCFETVKARKKAKSVDTNKKVARPPNSHPKKKRLTCLSLHRTHLKSDTNPNQRKPTNQQTVNRKALQTLAAPNPRLKTVGHSSKASIQSGAEKRRHPVLVQPGRCPRGRSGLRRGGRDGEDELTGELELARVDLDEVLAHRCCKWICGRGLERKGLPLLVVGRSLARSSLAALAPPRGFDELKKGERKASVGGRGAEQRRGFPGVGGLLAFVYQRNPSKLLY